MKSYVLPVAAVAGLFALRSPNASTDLGRPAVAGSLQSRAVQKPVAAARTFMVLKTRYLVDHRYAVKGSVTDLRSLRNGLDYMITLEQLPKSEAKRLDGFVELATLTGAAVKVDGKPTNIKFFGAGARVYALVPSGRYHKGQKLTLLARGTTTISYAGQTAGRNRQLFGTSWPVQ